ncbi:predicted protein [Plenodomus lingam JN3]|uniref:Predicted protein n=1 Tax=Leptosphaeria maculans (strain JN3 / isolate v23.1.3 / race Av1-4-5-6-7-8) TaxID=985895 RepID=E4ZZZ7_LEPMJ|nr:predicted protein [Plenodomus lingam JN3]CBX96857.1 predicted protein [Plenodomus lingam JN3]
MGSRKRSYLVDHFDEGIVLEYIILYSQASSLAEKAPITSKKDMKGLLDSQ